MTVQVFDNMPAEVYHKAERFSASGIKKLLVSAQDFWKTSWFNENRFTEESEALRLGTAYHTRILEGEKAFTSRYAVPPDVDRRTKDGKAAYAHWILSNAGKTPIEEHHWRFIIEAGERIDCDSRINQFFRGGQAELSIFWDDPDSGIPMKARFDYKKEKQLNDLKTFSNSNGADLNYLITSHIKKYKYYVQLAVYNEAFKLAFGIEPEINLIFQQSGPVNNVVIRKFPQEILLFNMGQQEMKKGMQKFEDMYRKYGKKQWFDDIIVRELTDEDFPIWSYEWE